ncbi:MAG: 6-carboxytetrahydropterin synthase [Phycisphaerales bacterium]|nr:MAG: 6-carboxytetrahydropterin synthase [Phycisphaerales bacterium]
MVRLHRIVRFGTASWDGTGDLPRGKNSFAASPIADSPGSFGEFLVKVEGEVGPRTKYLIDIKDIDRVVRDLAIREIASRHASGDHAIQPAALLFSIMPRIASAIAALRDDAGARLFSIEWFITPYYSLTMSPSTDSNTPTRAVMRQTFDFAASHRLHVPELSDDENRRLFGKCNNPRGHGHNYRLRPSVEVSVHRDGTLALSLATLERIVDETILTPFDHKHLNEDTTEFNAQKGGVVPSVENIARVFFERLKPAIERAATTTPHNAAPILRSVEVWETDRTSAVYPA